MDGLRRVGATWHIEDLTKKEWDGLLILENVRIELEKERWEKEKTARLAQEALNKAKRGGRKVRG